MTALLQRLVALDRRVALMIVGAIGFLIAFESFIVLRAPFAELQTLQASAARMASALQRESDSAAALATLTHDLAAAEQALAGGLQRADDAMLPYLVTTLDAVAARHGVSFGGVKPPVSRTIGNFEEVSFNIEARGNYRALFDWLTEAHVAVAPLIATEVSVKAVDDGQRVTFGVRLSGYRLVPAAERNIQAAK